MDSSLSSTRPDEIWFSMRGKTEEAVLDNVRPDLARNLSHGFLIGVIRTQDRRQVHLVQQDYRHSLLILWYLWTPGRSPSILRAPIESRGS